MSQRVEFYILGRAHMGPFVWWLISEIYKSQVKA